MKFLSEITYLSKTSKIIRFFISFSDLHDSKRYSFSKRPKVPLTSYLYVQFSESLKVRRRIDQLSHCLDDSFLRQNCCKRRSGANRDTGERRLGGQTGHHKNHPTPSIYNDEKIEKIGHSP